ncbi:Hypothetical protein NTJ_09971 [Nesidiocoris tenuis]|uniref:Uncharacterized protein n=1 Tax=Nesidiocoris tenuis TaxID=355587 RepID=A0ABN7B1W6_9HEMI|nr:Hypothetical protein NTJ_09971 [Nesidiocoris tenuis]
MILLRVFHEETAPLVNAVTTRCSTTLTKFEMFRSRKSVVLSTKHRIPAAVHQIFKTRLLDLLHAHDIIRRVTALKQTQFPMMRKQTMGFTHTSFRRKVYQ